MKGLIAVFLILIPALLNATIKCPSCNTENDDNAKLCTKCGKYLIVVLKVTSDPYHAAVYLNDKLLGYTPLTETIPVGSYKLRIQKMGYDVVNQNITIAYLTEAKSVKTENRHFTLFAKRDPNIKQGRFFFDSHPQRADVFVNGSTIGQTPVMSEMLNPGKYKIRYLLEPYKIYEAEYRLEAGVEKDVFHKLSEGKEGKSSLPKITRYGGIGITVVGAGFLILAQSSYNKYKDAKIQRDIDDYWDKTKLYSTFSYVCIGLGISSTGISFIVK
ncbi:MAG: PEGA domain-containing protein [Candidatus Coatesbacteria bacterium]|nr:PEGA domain-containing protein [Candidatus Coatesbacteria bacterium]